MESQWIKWSKPLAYLALGPTFKSVVEAAIETYTDYPSLLNYQNVLWLSSTLPAARSFYQALQQLQQPPTQPKKKEEKSQGYTVSIPQKRQREEEPEPASLAALTNYAKNFISTAPAKKRQYNWDKQSQKTGKIDDDDENTTYTKVGMNLAQKDDGDRKCINRVDEATDGEYLGIANSTKRCDLATKLYVDNDTDLSLNKIRLVTQYVIMEKTNRKFEPSIFKKGCTVIIRTKNVVNEMFKNCNNIARVVFKGEATTIGEEAFSGCKELNLEGTENVISIGTSAFDSCRFAYAIFPNVTELGFNPFAGNERLFGIRLSLNFVGAKDNDGEWAMFFGDLKEGCLVSGGPSQESTYKEFINNFVKDRSRAEILNTLRRLMTEKEINDRGIKVNTVTNQGNEAKERAFLEDLAPLFDPLIGDYLKVKEAEQERRRQQQLRQRDVQRQASRAARAEAARERKGAGAD